MTLEFSEPGRRVIGDVYSATGEVLQFEICHGNPLGNFRGRQQFFLRTRIKGEYFWSGWNSQENLKTAMTRAQRIEDTSVKKAAKTKAAA